MRVRAHDVQHPCQDARPVAVAVTTMVMIVAVTTMVMIVTMTMSAIMAVVVVHAARIAHDVQHASENAFLHITKNAHMQS
jgi:hypothetical protein